MKLLMVLGALAFVAVAYAKDDEQCYLDVHNACSETGNTNEIPNCNSLYSGYSYKKNIVLSKYANDLIRRSYQYLLLSKAFSTYKKNRPGFEKLYKTLADDTWEAGVHVMQHITKRGGIHDFNTAFETSTLIGGSAEVSELMSLSIALDTEKALAVEAHRIHQHYSHVKDTTHYDPEIAHYIEEKFIGKQAENVRKLSGYANELKKLMGKDDTMSSTPLGIYLFDQYLESQ
jgi:ferritin heavy chain